MSTLFKPIVNFVKPVTVELVKFIGPVKLAPPVKFALLFNTLNISFVNPPIYNCFLILTLFKKLLVFVVVVYVKSIVSSFNSFIDWYTSKRVVPKFRLPLITKLLFNDVVFINSSYIISVVFLFNVSNSFSTIYLSFNSILSFSGVFIFPKVKFIYYALHNI